jgi:TldD protein
MKTAAQLALDAASVRGVTYADARVVAIRNRSLTTKNGRVGHASESESLGIGVRVIADGAWGFAASADLSRARWKPRPRGRSRLRAPRRG